MKGDILDKLNQICRVGEGERGGGYRGVREVCWGVDVRMM